MSITAVGGMIRQWRNARRLSQLALANEAEVSARHLSFLETGKSKPSREMVLVLASALDIPLRERNAMLAAAGFTPAYRETEMGDDAMRDIRRVLELVLRQQEPYPAVAVDRRGEILMSNQGAAVLTARACLDHEAVLADGPPNLFRLLLHPGGLRPSLTNWVEVARAVIGRAQRELRLEPDDELRAVLAQVLAYPDVPGELATDDPTEDLPPYLPTCFAFDGMELSFVSTITTLGTPVDITLSELRVEAFFPAEENTERAFRTLLPNA